MHDFILRETISAVANDGYSYPVLIISNSFLSIFLSLIGILRFIQLNHQINCILPDVKASRLKHLHRLNLFTLFIGGIAVFSCETLAIIRIRISYDVHITFAQICFWAVVFYQFFHIFISWKLTLHHHRFKVIFHCFFD